MDNNDEGLVEFYSDVDANYRNSTTFVVQLEQISECKGIQKFLIHGPLIG